MTQFQAVSRTNRGMKIDLTPAQLSAIICALENVDAAGDFSEWAEATPARERAAMRAGLAKLWRSMVSGIKNGSEARR